MNRYEGGCTTVVIGRKASATGHVLIGHNEDDDKSIVMVHSVPHEKHEADEFVTFGDRPGVKIPQVRETAGYIWSEVRRPNGGISFGDSFFNEYGVAVVTNSANPGKAPEDENGSQDPYLATMGIGYGVRRLVAERAKTAREGLDVIIELVEKYGYFSSRTYQIADKLHIRSDVTVRSVLKRNGYPTERGKYHTYSPAPAGSAHVAAFGHEAP